MLRKSPYLVRPIHSLLALGPKSQHSAFRFRMRLWRYRKMAQTQLAQETLCIQRKKLESLLDPRQKWSVYSYEDALCEFPERLVAEGLGEALEAGAVVRNHAQVLAVNVHHGRAQGVLVRDLLNGKEEQVQATWIINATGPWFRRLCQRSRISPGGIPFTNMRHTHIILPRFPGAPDAAVATTATDGEPISILPWNEQILVGATEVPDQDDPAKAVPSPEEIQYLLHSFLRVFPRTRVKLSDVRYAFAGISPEPFLAKEKKSRSGEYVIHNHTEDGAANMISVVGGRLATALQLARDCAAKIGIASGAKSKSSTDTSSDLLPDQWVLEMAHAAGISESSARGIVEWHGKRSSHIAKLEVDSVQMRAPLCSHTEHIVAEAVNAFVNECAVTLADVLLRRVPVALGACWSQACSREATSRIRAVMGWNDQQAAAELEAFENERASFLRKPAYTDFVLEAAAD